MTSFAVVGRVVAVDRDHGVRPPVALQVEFTSKCNLRCKMCPLTTGTSSTASSPGGMQEATFAKVLEMARSCGRVIVAGYGEPLTNPQCLPMLRALNEQGTIISMATNAIALSPAIARELSSLAMLTHIGVSIDSPDPGIYRSIRRGSLTKAMRGLTNLMEAIDDPARVVVNSVAMRETLGSLMGFPEILAGLRVRRWEVQSVIDYNEFAQSQGLRGGDTFAAFFASIEESCRGHGIELHLTAPERTALEMHDPAEAQRRFYGSTEWDATTTRQCVAPWEIPFVDKDGGVFPCCFAAAAGEAKLGSLDDADLSQIWRGSTFERFRHDLTDGRTTPEICRRCALPPLGDHPYAAWKASISSGTVTARHRRDARITVAFRNESGRIWLPTDPVRIATSAPQDGTSPLEHSSWLSPNRVVSLVSEVVAPGETMEVSFLVTRPDHEEVHQEFALVVDGLCWIPEARFTVTMATRRDAQLGTRKLRALLRRTHVGYRARQMTAALPGRARR